MRRKVLRDFVIGVLLLFVLPLAELSVAIAQESVFTVQQPDFQKSPYTGMTRQHWIQAGEYLLKGAFGYIHTLDDQMYFPKQLDKTYPIMTAKFRLLSWRGWHEPYLLQHPC